MNEGEGDTARVGRAGSGSVSARGRVLFMDDKEIVRSAVCEVLQAMGYEAVCAEEGEETLELYRRAREDGTPFDVVVLDLTVTRGMGGRETIEKLLEIDPSAKIVVSSGYPNDPVIVDYRRFGASAVIIKPYNSAELDEVLTKVLEA
jgi:two-component system cell cycle sensor histidine kinase/response regulator CckA